MSKESGLRRRLRFQDVHLRGVRKGGDAATKNIYMASVREQGPVAATRRVSRAPSDESAEKLVGRTCRQVWGVNAEQFLQMVLEVNATVQTQQMFDPNRKDGRCTQVLIVNRSNWANLIDQLPLEPIHSTAGSRLRLAE